MWIYLSGEGIIIQSGEEKIEIGKNKMKFF